MSDDLAERVENFLDLHHVMSLATLGPDGAHAANLFYARDGLTLFWVSDGDTRHSRHIAADPRVSATVAPDYADFAAIRGVQIRGRAEHVTATMQRIRLLALLAARYAFLGRMAEAPAKLRAAYERTQVYRLTPAEIVFIDNTKGFGHKETLTLER